MQPKTENYVVDQIIPSGAQIFSFDFNQSRYQKRPIGNTLTTLEPGHSKSSFAFPNWLAIPTPGHPFSPIKAISGPNGNFFLVDVSQNRICLFDTAGQIISTAALPLEVQFRNLEQMEFFWTRDGLFSFLDLRSGKVWQYAENRSITGSTDWQLRNTIQLPLNLESCLWEPYLKNPCCQKSNSKINQNNAVTCFDNYFNPVGSLNVSMVKEGYSVELLIADAKWKITFYDRTSNMPLSLFTLITNGSEAALFSADSTTGIPLQNSNSTHSKP